MLIDARKFKTNPNVHQYEEKKSKSQGIGLTPLFFWILPMFSSQNVAGTWYIKAPTLTLFLTLPPTFLLNSSKKSLEIQV